MVDFVIPPPPKEDNQQDFKIPPPPNSEGLLEPSVASDGFVIPPTPTEVKNSKLTEEELRKDPEWIRAAKNIYEWNEGRTLGFQNKKPKKLNSDQEYADYALRYMGWFNYNIPKMSNEAKDLKLYANQQQREDFVTLMDMYDNKKISLAGTGRLVTGLATDPTTYFGLATLGIGLGAREGAKLVAKQGIKELVTQGVKQGAKIGALEGAAYTTADNALRQSARIMSGQQEGFELGQSAKAATLGGVLGGVLGGALGGTGSYFKNKNNIPIQADEMVGPIDMVGPRLETPQPKISETTPKVEPTPEVTPKRNIDYDTWRSLSKEEKDLLIPEIAKNRGFDDDELFEILDDNIIPNFSKKEFRELVPSKYGINENGVITNPETLKIELPKSYKEEIELNYIKVGDRYLVSEMSEKPSVDSDIFLNSIDEVKDYLINKSFQKYKNPLDYKSDTWNNNIRPKVLNKLQQQTLSKDVQATTKQEKIPRSTTLPSILKRPLKPKKIKTARSLVFGVPKNDPNFEEIIGAIGYDVNKVPATRTSRPLYRADGSPDSDYLDLLVEQFDELGFGAGRGGAGETMGIKPTEFDKEDVLEILEQDLVLPEFEEINLQYQVKLKQYEEVTSALNRAGIDPNSLRGKTDEEVLDIVSQINEAEDLTGARVSDSFAAQFQDQPPVSAYADELASSDGGNINNIRAEDVIDPTPDGRDFQTDTTVDLNDRLVEVGIKIMDDLNIPRNPLVRISDQLEEVLSQAEGNPVARERLDSVLQKNNITLPQLANLFRGSITDSARRMQKLSSVSKSIQNLAEKIGKTAKPETWTTKLYNFIKQADNIRRGLLVSQIATAMRNNTAQLGRVTMKTLIDVFDNTLKQTFNPLRRAFGAEEAPVNYARSFELILNLTKNKKQAKDLTDLLTKYYVKDAENLFTRYSSDVADATQTSNAARVLKVGQKVTDGLNVFNRMQDFWYRRAVFANTITDVLLKKGIDINKVGISDDLLKYVNKADIEKAVDDALYFTYAKTPDVPIVKSLVDAVNSMPFLATGVIPFPRFMANAIAFQFRHSPLGFSALLTPKEIAKLKAGDYKTLSQAVVGTTLLLTAIEMKRKGSEDNKWYEVETSSGKTVDMRPYFPLTPYLLVADMFVRSESGRGAPDAKDVLQGLTGAQFRAGASIQLVQNALDGMAGLDTEEKFNKFWSDYTSNVLGGYLTPVRMFGDFIDAGRYYADEDFEGQKFRRPVPTGDFLTDTTNQLKTNIPFVREQFPEVESPTRKAAPGRPDTVTIPFTNIEAPGPLTRQLTGATVREEKNAAEREFDRLGFKMRDILPYSGNSIVDQTRAMVMGEVVEKSVPILIESDFYQSQTNEFKKVILKSYLQKIRKAANDYIQVNKINEKQFAKAAFNRQPKYIKALLNSQGITAENFIENYDKSNGENR